MLLAGRKVGRWDIFKQRGRVVDVFKHWEGRQESFLEVGPAWEGQASKKR